MNGVDIRNWLTDRGYTLNHSSGELKSAGPALLASWANEMLDDQAMIALRTARAAWIKADRQWWIVYALLPLVLAGALWNSWVLSKVVASYVAWFTSYRVEGGTGLWGLCLLFVFVFKQVHTHSLSDRPMGWWPSFFEQINHAILTTLSFLIIWGMGLAVLVLG